jgi:hypothetical protein
MYGGASPPSSLLFFLPQDAKGTENTTVAKIIFDELFFIFQHSSKFWKK